MSKVLKISLKSKNIKAVVSGKTEEIIEYGDDQNQETYFQEKLEEQYQKGYQEGYESAKEKLEKNYTDSLVKQSEEFYNILKGYEENIKSYENDFAKIVAKASMKIAEKVLQREVEFKSNIEDVIRDGISKILGANNISIKVNSQDYKYLISNKIIDKINSGLAKIKIETDDNISKGGCYIESEIGNVDARLETQLEEIKTKINNIVIDTEE